MGTSRASKNLIYKIMDKAGTLKNSYDAAYKKGQERPGIQKAKANLKKYGKGFY